jgi:TolB-like protein
VSTIIYTRFSRGEPGQLRFTYKGRAVDVKQIARDLGVQYVLEGSVRRSGKRVRVVAQLIDAKTGNHIWAERYDRAV